jgi:hypothetical protein
VIANLIVILLAEDRRFVGVLFEFEKIVGGIFEKEGPVFNAGAGNRTRGCW